QARKPIDLHSRQMIHEGHILAVDIAGVLEALAKPAQTVDDMRVKCSWAEEPNNRHRRLLRTRHQRPCHSRAAEQRDELAPASHSITSSATESSDGGTVRPSMRAVTALM